MWRRRCRRWNASSCRISSSTRPANYAHIFLPGSTFLEKDGTFTNAERRIQRVRKVMTPKNGNMADWQITQALARALGLDWHYAHPSEIMDEIARSTPTFAGVNYERLDRESLQWPVNAAHPDGSPIMHVDGFVRGKGKFMLTEYVATTEKVGPRYPLLLTTGRILSQYNVGARRGGRRTSSSIPRTCSRSIRRTPRIAACATATSSG